MIDKIHPRMFDTTTVVSLTSLVGTEEVIVTDRDEPKKVTVQDIADLGGGGDTPISLISSIWS